MTDRNTARSRETEDESQRETDPILDDQHDHRS